VPERRRAGAPASLVALLLLGGCSDCNPPPETLCGDCDEDFVSTDLGVYGAPPADGFTGDGALVEFLSENFNLPPPAGLDGSDTVLAKVLFEPGGVVVDARGIPGGTFRSRPQVRAAAPPFWLVVTNRLGAPVYWRLVEDPREVRSELPGPGAQPIRGTRVRVPSGLATLRVPFVAEGQLILHEAVPPGAPAKPPLADYTFDTDLPLRFDILGGLP
jgi:hypothetical protein